MQSPGKNKQTKNMVVEKDTYCVQTMGCQMNQADSERMAGVSKSRSQIESERERQSCGFRRRGVRTRDLATNVSCLGFNLRSQELQASGLREIDDPFRSQVIVLNTCSIRDHAEQKVYSYVGRHAQRKWLNPEVTIVVAGCVAQQEGEQLLRRVPEIDIVMGPQYANRLGELMDSVRQGNQVQSRTRLLRLQGATERAKM